MSAEASASRGRSMSAREEDPPRLDPYCLDPEMTCADYPDVRVMDAERLEIALREVYDDEEACDAVQVILREGWRPTVARAGDTG